MRTQLPEPGRGAMRTRWRGSLGNGLTLIFTFLQSPRPIRLPEPPPATEKHPWEDVYPSDLKWRVDLPVKPLHALLDDAVARFPDRPCIDFLGKKHSYRDVGALVDRAAKGFRN